jgi:hypothetical protein
MKLSNNKGAVLIAVYLAMFALVTLSSSVALFNFTELNDAWRYRETTAAFWLAEAGINQFLANTALLDTAEEIVIEEENGVIRLKKDEANQKFRIITSSATVGGSTRSIRIKYPSLSTIFENTITSGGDLLVEGRKSALIINDKMRLGGKVVNTSAYPLTLFEDVREGVQEGMVAITYPDADKNGMPDEFSDFVAFNRQLIQSYPETEVVYIQGDDTYTITPDSSLANTKIVYIEGSREGKGNAIIQFSGALGKDQKLTVIATGTVTHNQAGDAPKDSQLNVIAWTDYFETTALPSVQNGLIYTHGTAYFDELHDTSVTNGSIVANEGIVVREVWSTKTFNYADMRKKGIVPPGFEGLVGGGVSGYTRRPSSWEEVWEREAI